MIYGINYMYRCIVVRMIISMVGTSSEELQQSSADHILLVWVCVPNHPFLQGSWCLAWDRWWTADPTVETMVFSRGFLLGAGNMRMQRLTIFIIAIPQVCSYHNIPIQVWESFQLYLLEVSDFLFHIFWNDSNLPVSWLVVHLGVFSVETLVRLWVSYQHLSPIAWSRGLFPCAWNPTGGQRSDGPGTKTRVVMMVVVVVVVVVVVLVVVLVVVVKVCMTCICDMVWYGDLWCMLNFWTWSSVMTLLFVDPPLQPSGDVTQTADRSEFWHGLWSAKVINKNGNTNP